MASERAHRIAETQERERQNERMDKLERMVGEIHAALVGKGGKKSTPVDATGDVEPFEVPADELAETPVLVPVTKADADESKSSKGKK